FGDTHIRDGSGRTDHVELRLPHADRFKENHVAAGRVKDVAGLSGFLAQPAEAAAGSHASDEDTFIQLKVGHPDPVTQKGSSGEGARRIDGNDADALLALPVEAPQPVRDRALPGTGRARD